jgi:hypothetical protein
MMSLHAHKEVLVRTFSVLVVGFIAAACRPASFQVSADGGSPPRVSEDFRAAPPPREGGRVRSDELAATDASTLRDALNRTRPEFLRATSAVTRDGETATPIVYVDGRRLGNPDILQLIQVAEVAEVRLIRPAAARVLFGSGCDCAGGVIAVVRRNNR